MTKKCSIINFKWGKQEKVPSRGHYGHVLLENNEAKFWTGKQGVKVRTFGVALTEDVLTF